MHVQNKLPFVHGDTLAAEIALLVRCRGIKGRSNVTFTDTTEANKSPGSVCVCVCGIVIFVSYTVALLLLLPGFFKELIEDQD